MYTKTRWYYQLLSIVLVLALLVQLLPVQVLAASSTSNNTLSSLTNSFMESEQPPVTVVAEEETLRTETEKHFRMSDGSFMAVSYGMPVHYQDENGDWQDIDNTLSPVNNQGTYSVNNAQVATTFSGSLSGGELFSTSYNGTSVSISLLDTTQTSSMMAANQSLSAAAVAEQDESMVFNRNVVADTTVETESVLRSTVTGKGWTAEDVIPEKLQSSLLYENVFSGVDLLYTAYGYNIKEEIVVNVPQSAYCYDFSLELEGVAAELNEDGSVSLLNADQEEIYHIPAPYMRDAEGKTSYAVSYTLIPAAGGVTLRVEADAAWINAEDRVFPVTIDPTIEVAAGRWHDNIHVSYTTQAQPDTPHGGEPLVCVGYDAEEGTEENRTFAHFNNMPDIPAGAVVTEALFGLYMSYYCAFNADEMVIGAYEATQDKPDNPAFEYYIDWIHGLGWNTMPTYDTANMIDYTPVSFADNGQYCYWDLSELVKKWYAEETVNRTIGLAMTEGFSDVTKYATASFYAWEPNCEPMLFVTYRNVLGIEDYYSYATLGAGAAGTAYISDYTGQLTVVKGLVSYASSVNPFGMSLVYNSNYSANNDLSSDYPSEEFMNARIGIGWTLDVLQTVKIDLISNTAHIRYRDGDGTVHYFQKDALDDTESTVYLDEDGLGLCLTIDRLTTSYVLTDMQDNQYIFRSGKLLEIHDNDGNQYILHYENEKLTGIGQKNNGATAETTVASFTYTDDFLTAVTDAAGLVHTLSYTDNKLTSISMGSTVLAQYGYNENQLVSATDSESGYTLDFSYDAQNRINGYGEKDKNGQNGAQVSILTDATDKTTYQDHGNDRTKDTADDILTHYLFDNSGRTVNAYSTDASGVLIGADNAVYFDGEAATDKKNNRTTRTASIGIAAQQWLRNSSFESTASDHLWTLSSGASVTTDNPRTGTKALKFTGSAAKTASKSETLSAGQTYTLSAYVNTTEMTVMPADGVYLTVTDGSGNSWRGDSVDYQTPESINNGWMRVHVTFTAITGGSHTLSVCCPGGTGTLYVDDLQFEKGSALSNRNLLENSDFLSAALFWTFASGCYPTFSQSLGGAAAAIPGKPTNGNAKVTQEVPINLSGAETYVLSGWAKGKSVPIGIPAAVENLPDAERTFGLRATVHYGDGTEECFYAPFDPEVMEWQFTSLSIVPTETEKTVSTITVACVYECNANMAYFDNISLVRETVQSFSYDDDGNLTSVSTTGVTSDTNTYEDGNLIETVTGTGSTYSYTYDENFTHRLLSYTDGSTTQSMTYDGVGNVTSSVFAANEDTGLRMESASGYSADGNRVTSETDANNVTATYAYSTAVSQMLAAATSITDANNTVTNVTYDNLGRTTQTSVANRATLTYTYDSGNLSAITREDNNGVKQAYGMLYDSFGNVTDFTIGGFPLVWYEYGANNGQLVKQTYCNADTITYTYDNLGRMSTATYDDGRVVTYTYNGEGQLHSVKETGGDSPATYLYTYDATGNVVLSEKKDANGNTVLRVYQNYDSAGQLVGQTWCTGSASYSESYSYNVTDGSLNSMVTGTGETLQFSYDDLQRLTSAGNGLYIKNYSYRNLSDTRTTAQVSQVQYTGLPTALTYGYTYDALGNIATYSAPGKGTVTYTYDALGQLLSAVGDETYSYTYDSAGNILTANGHTYTFGHSRWKDMLTAYDGQSFTYDSSGNPLRYYNGSSWKFTWENGRSLATATDGAYSISYAYDANGLRTAKTVGNVTHNYLYASGQLLRETYGDNTLDFFYDASGYPYALKYNGTTYYYITNLQGDVMYLVDAQGNTVASYEYDPYGNITSATGTMADTNPLRYRGYYYDAELEMYYLQSRYYDPAIGRFINADALLDAGRFLGYNLFAYCANSPVNLKDESGFAIETVLDIGSIIVSLLDLIGCPTWANFGYLLWDIGSALIPFIPGSYAAKGGKIWLKVASTIDDFADGSKFLTGAYNKLKKLFKGIKGIEIHHLIEKRFSKLFSAKAGDFLSIPLTSELHRIITNRWRNLHKISSDFKYFKYGSNYSKITFSMMEKAIKEVYKDMPGLLDDVLEWFYNNWKW